MTIQFDQNRPIYLQLMEYFYGKICRFELEAGDKLPSVRETAVEVGVNPNTVSRTYMEMEREKVVISKRGQGTFVTEDQQMINELRERTAEKHIDAFLTVMIQNGFNEEEIMELIQKQLRIINKGGRENE
ncbi:GntR family transcriptional regulator [Evansella sp. AB-P1]|uniref:GntR family transcriptional regulator n=1 Tax=Evansella sp. AB-P1 TaxID=3037653 RepID=UPI002420011E|nr:GntR family transcriptional regulator [Evansella sp. AB-P1]MDG5787052.1 GntR family transcriptional regulator [Evansella sp. AB-P1]